MKPIKDMDKSIAITGVQNGYKTLAYNEVS
jgi:hypothetical protein